MLSRCGQHYGGLQRPASISLVPLNENSNRRTQTLVLICFDTFWLVPLLGIAVSVRFSAILRSRGSRLLEPDDVHRGEVSCLGHRGLEMIPRGARDQFVLVILIGTHAESEKRLVSNEEAA